MLFEFCQNLLDDKSFLRCAIGVGKIWYFDETGMLFHSEQFSSLSLVKKTRIKDINFQLKKTTLTDSLDVPDICER